MSRLAKTMDIQKAEHGFPIVSFTQQITRLGWLSIVLLLRIADLSFFRHKKKKKLRVVITVMVVTITYQQLCHNSSM